MKDDGKPYNPVIKYAPDGTTEEHNLSLQMINALCPELTYKYANGINCVHMKFKY